MRRWWGRRELGAVDAISVEVWPAGSSVGGRWVVPGRVMVTFEDARGWVVVESDLGSMVAMLGRLRDEVEAVRLREQGMWERVLLRAAQRRALAEGGGGGG